MVQKVISYVVSVVSLLTKKTCNSCQCEWASLLYAVKCCFICLYPVLPNLDVLRVTGPNAGRAPVRVPCRVLHTPLRASRCAGSQGCAVLLGPRRGRARGAELEIAGHGSFSPSGEARPAPMPKVASCPGGRFGSESGESDAWSVFVAAAAAAKLFKSYCGHSNV